MCVNKWKGYEFFRVLLVIQVYLEGMETLALRYALLL